MREGARRRRGGGGGGGGLFTYGLTGRVASMDFSLMNSPQGHGNQTFFASLSPLCACTSVFVVMTMIMM